LAFGLGLASRLACPFLEAGEEKAAMRC